MSISLARHVTLTIQVRPSAARDLLLQDIEFRVLVVEHPAVIERLVVRQPLATEQDHVLALVLDGYHREMLPGLRNFVPEEHPSPDADSEVQGKNVIERSALFSLASIDVEIRL